MFIEYRKLSELYYFELYFTFLYPNLFFNTSLSSYFGTVLD